MESPLTSEPDPARNGVRSPLRLFFLGGGEAPPELSADLLSLGRLPASALQSLWHVLEPSLAQAIEPATGQLLDAFCAEHALDDGQLARAIKACRFVIREAARLDAPEGALSEDVERLCPGEALLKEIVLAAYGRAKVEIRRDIIKATLADHGKLLVDLKWRVDAIHASESGMRLGMPVALLTLLYREGGEAGRITLQVLPDMLGRLRTACEAMVG